MDDLNIVGNMHWNACNDCKLYEQCGDKKNKANYVTTHNEVICKNHSNEILAEIGTLDMMSACTICKVYDNHFKDCGLNTIYGLPEIKLLITAFDVRCLSFEQRQDAWVLARSHGRHPGDNAARILPNSRLKAGSMTKKMHKL